LIRSFLDIWATSPSVRFTTGAAGFSEAIGGLRSFYGARARSEPRGAIPD
jgi:hypothetical protein